VRKINAENDLLLKIKVFFGLNCITVKVDKKSSTEYQNFSAAFIEN